MTCYEPDEDETARRQIREDHDERQDEINYPIIVRRGNAVTPKRLTWTQRIKRAFRIAIGR